MSELGGRCCLPPPHASQLTPPSPLSRPARPPPSAYDQLRSCKACMSADPAQTENRVLLLTGAPPAGRGATHGLPIACSLPAPSWPTPARSACMQTPRPTAETLLMRGCSTSPAGQPARASTPRSWVRGGAACLRCAAGRTLPHPPDLPPPRLLLPSLLQAGIGLDFQTQLVENISAVKGANYFSVHSEGEFKSRRALGAAAGAAAQHAPPPLTSHPTTPPLPASRLGDNFDYAVSPLVFDLRLGLGPSSMGGGTASSQVRAHASPTPPPCCGSTRPARMSAE